MTLQMNSMALISSGFKRKAVYKSFEKRRDGSWCVETAECFQNGDECVIKLYNNTTRKTFTLYYDNKEDANKKMKHLISIGYKKDKH